MLDKFNNDEDDDDVMIRGSSAGMERNFDAGKDMTG
jgi:hypothetical protein